MSTSTGVRRLVGLVAVTAVVLGSIAACGSDGPSDANAPSPSGGSSSAAAAPTGSVIKIGVIGSNTGSQASSSAQGSVVAPAWAEWVNKELGGINGHPVEVTVVDDKGDPASAKAGGAQLIADGVQVVVTTSDNLIAAFDDDVIAAKIPIVSGAVNTPDWNTKVGMFPVVIDAATSTGLTPLLGKQFSGATKYGIIYCSEVAACAQGAAFQKTQAEKLGLPFIQLGVSGSASSYTSQCLSFKQQKADYVFLAAADFVASKFIQDCQAQGYNPTWGVSQNTVSKGTLALKNVTITGPANALPEAGNNESSKTFRDVMKKYAKSDNWHYGSSTFTWSGLEVVRKALAGVNASTAVTATTVMDGLYTIKDDDLGGLLANKITFTRGQPVKIGQNACEFVLQIKDGVASTLNDEKGFCLPSS